MRYLILSILILLSLFTIFVPNAIAQTDSLTLSITPPLFQLTIGKGEFWASSLKVVNSNPYDLQLNATVMNFEAEGEYGKGKFTPIFEDPDDPEKKTYSLANWIDISKEPIFVPSGSSKDIPFTVSIPENAEPGGHYAAILVGVGPGNKTGDGSMVKISSFVSSLLFVRIEGEIVEKGMIRQFSSEKSFYEKPEANFILKFENTGNVHLQPQGDIVIYNMWGKERGRVLINNKSNFGNVLPNSSRKFEFKWSGESNSFEIGRYTAEATLAFGDGEKQNITAKTYFWIVPVKPVAIGLVIVFSFVTLIFWFIRRYIRKALAMESKRMGVNIDVQEKQEVSDKKTERPIDIHILVEPLREGVLDLRKINSPKNQLDLEIDSVKDIKTKEDVPLTFFQFFKKYVLFFIFVAILLMGMVGFFIYLREVLVPERDFNVEVKTDVNLIKEIEKDIFGDL